MDQDSNEDNKYELLHQVCCNKYIGNPGELISDVIEKIKDGKQHNITGIPGELILTPLDELEKIEQDKLNQEKIIKDDMETIKCYIKISCDSLNILNSETSVLQSDFLELNNEFKESRNNTMYLQNLITSLQKTTESFRSIITKLQQEVNDANIVITTTLQSDVSNLKNITSTISKQDIITLKNDISIIQTNITLLQSLVTGLQNDTANLQSAVTSLQNDVTTLQNKLSSLQTTVSSLQITVNTLQNIIVTLQSTIGVLQTDVAILQVQLSTKLNKDGSDPMTGNLNMGGHDIVNVNLIDGVNINTLQSDVSTLQSEVTTLQGSSGFGGKISLDGSIVMTGDLNIGGNDIINMNLINGIDLSAFKTDYDNKVDQNVKSSSSPMFNSMIATSNVKIKRAAFAEFPSVVSSGANDFTFGMEFTVVMNITVISLLCYADPLWVVGTRNVVLWSIGGIPLASENVNVTDPLVVQGGSNFRQKILGSSVNLLAGQTYVIGCAKQNNQFLFGSNVIANPLYLSSLVARTTGFVSGPVAVFPTTTFGPPFVITCSFEISPTEIIDLTNVGDFTKIGIMPNITGLDLGSSSFKWNNFYVNNAISTSSFETKSGSLIGFFGQPLVGQYTELGIAGIASVGVSSQVYDDTTFDGGGFSSNVYTIGDIVRALKLYGLIVS
jgi:predicted  nucleic acid-binding Zn-ribbon protein